LASPQLVASSRSNLPRQRSLHANAEATDIAHRLYCPCGPLVASAGVHNGICSLGYLNGLRLCAQQCARSLTGISCPPESERQIRQEQLNSVPAPWSNTGVCRESWRRTNNVRAVPMTAALPVELGDEMPEWSLRGL